MNLNRFEALFDLSGKIALVTGSSRGIGMAICNALFDAGAKVVATDIVMPEDSGLYPGITDRRILDVTIEKDVENMMADIVRDYGRLDILVNNAGIIYKDRIENLDVEHFKQVIDVNLNGTVICTKYAVPYMQKQHDGRILNIASSQAFLALETYTPYAASKTAIAHLTRIWGNELAKDNILVNALCPCYANTSMMIKAQKKMAIELNTDEAGGRRYYEELIPLKRILDVEEVGNWAVALCSELGRASTGSNFAITCGQVQL